MRTAQHDGQPNLPTDKHLNYPAANVHRQHLWETASCLQPLRLYTLQNCKTWS